MRSWYSLQAQMCIAIRYMEREITDDKVSGMIHKGEIGRAHV